MTKIKNIKQETSGNNKKHNIILYETLSCHIISSQVKGQTCESSCLVSPPPPPSSGTVKPQGSSSLILLLLHFNWHDETMKNKKKTMDMKAAVTSIINDQNMNKKIRFNAAAF